MKPKLPEDHPDDKHSVTFNLFSNTVILSFMFLVSNICYNITSCRDSVIIPNLNYIVVDNIFFNII